MSLKDTDKQLDILQTLILLTLIRHIQQRSIFLWLAELPGHFVKSLFTRLS